MKQHIIGTVGTIFAALCSVVSLAAIWFSPPLVLLGLLGLITSSAWDIYLHKTCPAQAPGPSKTQG